jgi:hypothetical protein
MVYSKGIRVTSSSHRQFSRWTVCGAPLSEIAFDISEHLHGCDQGLWAYHKAC